MLICVPLRWVFVSPKVSSDLIWTLRRSSRNNTPNSQNVQRAKAVALGKAGKSSGWDVCAGRGNECISSPLSSLCGVCEQCHEPTAIPAGNSGSLQTHQHNVTHLNTNGKHFLLKKNQKTSCEVESRKVSNILTAKSSGELMFLGRLFVYQWVVQTKENQNGQV